MQAWTAIIFLVKEGRHTECAAPPHANMEQEISMKAVQCYSETGGRLPCHANYQGHTPREIAGVSWSALE
jgi:hypothetical protein